MNRDSRQPPSGRSLRDELLRAQNPDGGWGYGGSISWTEPTAYAVLALLPADASSVSRGIRWLRSMQRPGGGYRPTAAVDESTWVTSLAILALRKVRALSTDDPSIAWLLEQTGRESAWTVRVRQFLLGARPDHSAGDSGWPWYPGAAAWVMPTAFSILALRALQETRPDVRSRLVEGRQFLLSRKCADGGWNHGSSRALGYDAVSYPETTGIALLALQGGDTHVPPESLSAAERQLAECRSGSAANWLRMGLLAHGRLPQQQQLAPQANPKRHNIADAAIARIFERSLGGTNVFLQ